MPERPSRFDQQVWRPRRSPYERLRLHGAIRGAIIAYGIGALTLLFPWPMGSPEAPAPSFAAGAVPMLMVGVALQLLVLVVRRLVAGREQAAGREGHLSPIAMFLFELLVDGATVLLFALATFRGIAQYVNSV